MGALFVVHETSGSIDNRRFPVHIVAVSHGGRSDVSKSNVPAEHCSLTYMKIERIAC